MTTPVSSPSVRTPVKLAPVPGFCIKSRTTAETAVQVSNGSGQPPVLVPIARNTKVFVNIAWDDHVPPPSSPDKGVVPLIVSDPRQDADKAGQSALVFDAVFNQAVKRLVAQDTEFKAFIIELALQQIETQTPLVLSRQIGTPNIASKGVPRTREVLLPTAARPPPPPLIEELPGGGASSAQTPTDDDDRARPRLPTPAWTCTRTDVDGVRRRRITVQVPKLTRALVTGATLDIEARRMMLRVPSLCALELDVGALGDDGGAAGTDELDVDGARAEWRVREGVIVVYA